MPYFLVVSAKLYKLNVSLISICGIHCWTLGNLQFTRVILDLLSLLQGSLIIVILLWLLLPLSATLYGFLWLYVILVWHPVYFFKKSKYCTCNIIQVSYEILLNRLSPNGLLYCLGIQILVSDYFLAHAESGCCSYIVVMKSLLSLF